MGGACKYFQWPEKKVMDMAWANLMLYLATIPSYDEEGEGKPENKVVDANNLSLEEAQRLLNIR